MSSLPVNDQERNVATNERDSHGSPVENGQRVQMPINSDTQGAKALRQVDTTPRHRLDSEKIVQTSANLAVDIAARLPGSALEILANELQETVKTADDRVRRAQEPILSVRIVSAVAIAAVLLALWYLVRHIHARWEFTTINDVFDGIHTGFELLVMLAGVIWFCATLEARMKRKAALSFIEELREFVHVIDVTQLYYTPEIYGSRAGEARTTLVLDETYLLFCTQMLGVISNLAPLCARGAPVDSVLRAASDVEMLAIAVTTKHLSKADFVRATQAISR